MNRLRTQMRWIMVIIVVAFLLSTFLMYGDGSRGSGSSSDATGDYAVAEINGDRLMASELYEHLIVHMENAGGMEPTSMDFQSVLEEYAVESQMELEIRDSGITVPDAEVDLAMKEYIDLAFPTRESFYQTLERSGMTLDDYKADLTRQMVRQKFIEESIGEVVISDDEAIEFYDSMKDLFFRKPAGYMVNLARFSSENDARRFRSLLSYGRPWSEAVSNDIVASSDVLYITEQPEYVPDYSFDDYLSPMKSDDIGVASRVFEVTSNDFAVGVKSERVEEGVASYDEVSGDVQAFLQQQKSSEAANNFSTGLLSRANIVILDPSLFPSVEPDFQSVQPLQPVTGDTVSADVSVPPVSTDAVVTSGDQ